MNREPYFSEPRYISKVNDGCYKYAKAKKSNAKKVSKYDSSDDEFSDEFSDESHSVSNSLMEHCVKLLTGKEKTQLSLLDSQYPKIHEYIIDEIKDIKEEVFDSITQLYLDQIHFRYPEMIQQRTGVHPIPLLKCCLMNQSIRVVATHEPLVLDILPV